MANKKDVADMVAENLEISKKAAGEIVNTVIGAITELYVKDGEVKLVGFGTFTTSARKARTARNPKTGEPIDVPAKTAPKMNFAKALKDEIEANFPNNG